MPRSYLIVDKKNESMGRKPSFGHKSSRGKKSGILDNRYVNFGKQMVVHSAGLCIILPSLFLAFWFVVGLMSAVSAGFLNIIYHATNIVQFREMADAALRVSVATADIFIAILDLILALI